MVVMCARAGQWRVQALGHEPLPAGVINGLVLEPFERVAESLQVLVTRLSAKGLPVAMALPAHAALSVSFQMDTPADTWSDLGVLEALQAQGHLPAGQWCVDFGAAPQIDDAQDGAVAPKKPLRGWAVVARQEAVMERFALAESAGLVPQALDLDNEVCERLLALDCERTGHWPTLWLYRRAGLLTAYLCTAPGECQSASRYWSSLGDDTTLSLADAMQATWQPWLALLPVPTVLQVRCSGLDALADAVLDSVQQQWPHAYLLSAPEASWLEATRSPCTDMALALALALHPALS